LKKITIRCRNHGYFEQVAQTHLESGCPTCHSESRVKTLDQFIIDARLEHGGTYNYSKVAYKIANCKVVIICNKHGDFHQTPRSHLSGSGCPICSGSRKNTEEFIKQAILKHGYTYDYSTVNYRSALEKVIIVCKKHGDFEQIGNAHLKGAGCPSCAKTGFDVCKPANLYILITDSSFIGFGITGSLRERLTTHSRNLRKQNIEIVDTHIFSGSGEDILEAEQYIKRNFANHRTIIEGFKTEAFTNDKLQDVLTYLRSNTKLL
jgi:Zn finger protein HypA/HybF involved in hydrogenase expression